MNKYSKKDAKTFIRTVKLAINSKSNPTNKTKLSDYADFVCEYRKAVSYYVNHLWNTKLSWNTGSGKVMIWDLENDYLDLPAFISTTEIKFETSLSARALKCASTQACGILKAVADKRNKDLSLYNYLLRLNKTIPKSLTKSLANPITKPDLGSIDCEINSIIAACEAGGNSFDLWFTLKSIFNSDTKTRGFTIKIPLVKQRRYLKWEATDSKILNSFLINEKEISVRFEVKTPAKKLDGKSLAIDQGKVTCLTASNKTESSRCIHGHDLNSICEKASKKKWGSKAFKRAVSHRKNHINWVVNQVSLVGINTLKLEQITNINFGKNVSRSMKFWSNTLIRDSLIKRCEEEGVLFQHVSNEYNSQRCSCCGWTQKKNRKAKLFVCCNHKCKLELDADYNASLNINIRDQLFELPFGFRSLKKNISGFFWTEYGLFDKDGQVLTVSVSSL